MMCRLFDNKLSNANNQALDPTDARVITRFSDENSFIFNSENKSNGFCIAFKKKVEGCVGLDMAIIIYDESGSKDSFSELTLNTNDPTVLKAYDNLKQAADNGLQTFMEALNNLNTQDSRLSLCAKMWARDIQKSTEKQANQFKLTYR